MESRQTRLFVVLKMGTNIVAIILCHILLNAHHQRNSDCLTCWLNPIFTQCLNVHASLRYFKALAATITEQLLNRHYQATKTLAEATSTERFAEFFHHWHMKRFCFIIKNFTPVHLQSQAPDPIPCKSYSSVLIQTSICLPLFYIFNSSGLWRAILSHRTTKYLNHLLSHEIF